MNNPVEQNKTVRLLKTKLRLSSSGSENYVSGTNVGSPIIKKPASIIRFKGKQTRASQGRKIKVVDVDGEDVTPRPLRPLSDPDAKRSLFFLEQLHEQFDGSSSASDTSSGRTDFSSRESLATTFPVDSATTKGTDGSLSLAAEESLSVFELQRPQKFQHEETQSDAEVTEKMLDELVLICLSETATISLLDIPSKVLPDDCEDAEEQNESNRRYIELCRSKPGNEKFVERGMQTLNNASKTTGIQTDTVVTADAGSMATNWDIYDSMDELITSTAVLDNEKTNGTENMLKTPCKEERFTESNSTTASSSTVCSSVPDHQDNVDGPQSGPDLLTVMNTQEFLHSLQITERNIVANIYQHKLATYKGLPILPDPYCTEAEEQQDSPESEAEHPEVFPDEAPLRPALNLFWSFSCELTAGCVTTSISWHKKSPDILAVGYDNSAKNKNTPGLICVWSLKNITWPECVIYIHSAVTTLDFSPDVLTHLGVGMMDGTVAIYNIANRRCVASTTHSSQKHLQHVSVVSWHKRILVSISVDGLIKAWLVGDKRFECTDLFHLTSVKNSKKEPLMSKKKSGIAMGGGGVAPGLCFHFNPVDFGIYLAGTRQGLIHMCSYSNRSSFLETYKKHLSSVNSVAWSPFSPNLFLSGSSDWTVQLWSRYSSRPVLGFSSSQTAVLMVCWSPKWPTVFAVLRSKQLEIWDLKTNIQDPAVVLSAPESKELTSIQFCLDTDAVILGDSLGEVSVYQLQNFDLSTHGQVVSLEDVILSLT